MKRVTCQGVSGPSSATIHAAMPRSVASSSLKPGTTLVTISTWQPCSRLARTAAASTGARSGTRHSSAYCASLKPFTSTR